MLALYFAGALFYVLDVSFGVAGEVNVAVGMDAKVADRGGWCEDGVGWCCR